MKCDIKCAVVGLGVQGKKRLRIAEGCVAASVDPVQPNADFKRIEEVPLGSFDAALVCTPDDAKLEILRYLITNGKHVLVEKPLVLEQKEFLELRTLAEEKKVVCYTAYNHRFEPNIIELRKVFSQQTLGKIHLTKIFYGNGTARDVRNSPWRDTRSGVLTDLGSHLLDMVLYLFHNSSAEVPKMKLTPWSFNSFENKAFDHVSFGIRLQDTLIECEATLLSWRNTFRLDMLGELGSAHIDCLCKWGDSTFVTRKRKLPSGRPEEEIKTVPEGDPTWELEWSFFLELCRQATQERRAITTLDKDIWIDSTLRKLLEDYKAGSR